MWSPAPTTVTDCPSPSHLKRLVSVSGEFPGVCLSTSSEQWQSPRHDGLYPFQTPSSLNVSLEDIVICAHNPFRNHEALARQRFLQQQIPGASSKPLLIVGQIPVCNGGVCLFVLLAERKINTGFSFTSLQAVDGIVAFSPTLISDCTEEKVSLCWGTGSIPNTCCRGMCHLPQLPLSASQGRASLYLHGLILSIISLFTGKSTGFVRVCSEYMLL